MVLRFCTASILSLLISVAALAQTRQDLPGVSHQVTDATGEEIAHEGPLIRPWEFAPLSQPLRDPSASSGQCTCQCSGHRSPCLSCVFSGVSRQGCRPFCHCDYCAPYKERPFGTFTRQTLLAQVANGALAQMVFYDFHFSFDEAENRWHLTAAGQFQADKVAHLLYGPGFTVSVQAVADEKSNFERRDVVLQALVQRGVALGIDQIVAHRLPTNGISGEEAMLILNDRLTRPRYGATNMQTGNFLPTLTSQGVEGNQ